MAMHKSVRKSMRRKPRTQRKSVRKSPRKSMRKSVRRSKAKSMRKSVRKSPRKSMRKSVRKSPRKSMRRSRPSRPRMSMISDLPPEMMSEVARRLDNTSLQQLRLTSKMFEAEATRTLVKRVRERFRELKHRLGVIELTNEESFNYITYPNFRKVLNDFVVEKDGEEYVAIYLNFGSSNIDISKYIRDITASVNIYGLRIENNLEVTDFSAFKNIYELDASSTLISNDDLSDLKNVRILSISDTAVTDVSGLKGGKLKVLYAYDMEYDVDFSVLRNVEIIM